MIRTSIEVTGDTEWDHRRKLEAVLDSLGYEPKRSSEHGHFMADLFEELRERDMNPQKLVEERRSRLCKAG